MSNEGGRFEISKGNIRHFTVYFQDEVVHSIHRCRRKQAVGFVPGGLFFVFLRYIERSCVRRLFLLCGISGHKDSPSRNRMDIGDWYRGGVRND